MLRLGRDAMLAAYRADPVPTLGPNTHWVITETGYHTWIGSGWFEGVDEQNEAEYGLMLLLNIVEWGGEEAQWYHVQDAWGPPHNGEEAFGVFDHHGSPKPLAIALHNLMTLLEDRGAEAKSFVTTSRAYTLSGNLGQQPFNGVYHLMMQKSDGTYILAVWREGELWDMQTRKPISLIPQTTTVTLAKPASKVEVFDPIKSGEPEQVLVSVTQVDPSLVGHPLILKIKG